MAGTICSQCVHDRICKFCAPSMDFEKAVQELIDKYGKEVFFAHLDCRHKQKNPIVTGTANPNKSPIITSNPLITLTNTNAE